MPVRGTRIAAIAALTMAGRGVHGRRAQHQPGQARGQRAYQGCGRGGPVTITPANGATAADPSAGITVTAKHGTLTNVVVHSAGGAVSGSMSQAGTVWHSQWALAPSQSYTVTATGLGGGTGDEHVPDAHAGPDVPDRDPPGIQPDLRRRAADPPVLQPEDHEQGRGRAGAAAHDLEAGSWRLVLGRLRHGPHLRLLPAAGLLAVRHHRELHRAPERRAGRTRDLRRPHADPDVQHRPLADRDRERQRRTSTQIYYNGKLRYDWPISAGRPGDDTPNGSYLSIEKENPVQMTGPGYAWRFRTPCGSPGAATTTTTPTGPSASRASRTSATAASTSRPADAQTYYDLAVPGDPITIVGSPKGGTWDNGWTEWFLSWTQYLQGSALHEAVQAGPDGSTFVSPSSLPPDTATAPLQTAPANNASAG